MVFHSRGTAGLPARGGPEYRYAHLPHLDTTLDETLLGALFLFRCIWVTLLGLTTYSRSFGIYGNECHFKGRLVRYLRSEQEKGN